MGHRGVLALEDVMQENSFAGIFGHGKSHGIRGARRRNARTCVGVAQIAEIAQHGLIRKEFLAVGATRPAKTAAQRQTMRERPGDRVGSFRGEEVRTSHSRPILVPAPGIV